MEVVETPDSIKIQFLPNGIPYDSIYNREYFLLLGIKIIESDEEKKIGGLHQYYKDKQKTKKNKSFPDSIIDSADAATNKATDSVKGFTEGVIESVEKGESKIESFFFSDLKKNEVEIKKNKYHVFKTLDKEIQEFYDRSKTIFNFDSGYTYNEYASVIKDLYIQLAYMKFLKIKIDQIDFKRVFKINGRYALLEPNVKEMEDTEDQSNYFLDLERKMVELTGKKYEKGQIERDLKLIDGTEIWKYKELFL
jgi:hypothetical protein